MRKATIDDANSLGIELNRLTTAGDELLIAISEPIRPVAAAAESTKSQNKLDSPQTSTDLEEITSSFAKIAPISIHGARGVDSTRWMEPPRSPSPEAEQRTLKYKQCHSPRVLDRKSRINHYRRSTRRKARNGLLIPKPHMYSQRRI
jgi:hypothetical protein